MIKKKRKMYILENILRNILRDGDEKTKEICERSKKNEYRYLVLSVEE